MPKHSTSCRQGRKTHSPRQVVSRFRTDSLILFFCLKTIHNCSGLFVHGFIRYFPVTRRQPGLFPSDHDIHSIDQWFCLRVEFDVAGALLVKRRSEVCEWNCCFPHLLRKFHCTSDVNMADTELTSVQIGQRFFQITNAGVNTLNIQFLCFFQAAVIRIIAINRDNCFHTHFMSLICPPPTVIMDILLAFRIP